MYLDGLTPPEWSACGRFLKEGLAEGDFYDIDIRIEIAPNMTTALQWLVDNIPLEAWRRWGEIFTEHPEYHPEYQVYLDMDRWLEGLEKCSGLSSAICYIEMHPPHFWSLGWIIDRELFRCLRLRWHFARRSASWRGSSMPWMFRSPNRWIRGWSGAPCGDEHFWCYASQRLCLRRIPMSLHGRRQYEIPHVL